MSEVPLPSCECIDNLLPRLFGEGVKAKIVAVGPDLAKPYVLASYADVADVVRSVLVCDLALANSLGAAFSMIPPTVANDATKSGSIPENIQLNLHEVLNILVNLFTEHWSERLTLSGFTICLPDAVQPAVKESVQYSVTMSRYTGGTILAGLV